MTHLINDWLNEPKRSRNRGWRNISPKSFGPVTWVQLIHGFSSVLFYCVSVIIFMSAVSTKKTIFFSFWANKTLESFVASATFKQTRSIQNEFCLGNIAQAINEKKWYTNIPWPLPLKWITLRYVGFLDFQSSSVDLSSCHQQYKQVTLLALFHVPCPFLLYYWVSHLPSCSLIFFLGSASAEAQMMAYAWFLLDLGPLFSKLYPFQQLSSSLIYNPVNRGQHIWVLKSGFQNFFPIFPVHNGHWIFFLSQMIKETFSRHSP